MENLVIGSKLPDHTNKQRTPCEKLRDAIVTGHTPGTYKPRCEQNGSYQPVQCKDDTHSHCWCVNDEGHQIPGSVAVHEEQLDCSQYGLYL